MQAFNPILADYKLNKYYNTVSSEFSHNNWLLIAAWSRVTYEHHISGPDEKLCSQTLCTTDPSK